MEQTFFLNGELEKKSCAVTLSDMEIFVFPELFYALVLANIMSPRIWLWRDDPWFDGLQKKTARRKIDRCKQYIIDHYEFNLDLDTWGLTDKETELQRFAPYMDLETLRHSNALFGYEGDRHYFDLDIRRHFGLEKYSDDIIPYWKTETVEAMDAFVRRPGYRTGAGECVSLAALYAAALFIVCGIPLEDIFLMATPLHSQNFIATGEGILTNNRRIVTKTMWFNGTELSDKAQRALRNEQITMVMNNTGYIHCVDDTYTIDPEHYRRFQEGISAYLSTEITFEILANFLRQHSRFQSCFQICHDFHGKKRWIAAERAYAYEHGSPYKVGDHTRDKLLEEIDAEEFYCSPIPERICLPKLEEFFKNNPIRHVDEKSMIELGQKLECTSFKKDEMLAELARFVHLDPDFPGTGGKTHRRLPVIDLTPGMSREQIIARIEALRPKHPSADLAFYAARDLTRTPVEPFLKAALERNPVCIQGLTGLDNDALIDAIDRLDNDSIYDESRMAQPDEVWNFKTGDGAEKAVLLYALLRHRHPGSVVSLEVRPDRAEVLFDDRTITWPSSKGVTFAARAT